MVQLPEVISSDKVAYTLGYKTIDEIGRERIRRAAKKIKEEIGADIDYGFKTYRLEKLDDKKLSELLDFTNDIKLIKDDTVDYFKTSVSSGKESILSTYLVLDGYGLSKNTEKYKLSEYEVDKIEDSIYIIEKGLSSIDVMELIRKIESLELNITRIVVYVDSLKFSVMQELKNNLSNLSNNKQVELIERY